MRVNFSTNWIFQGWITHLIFVLCAQEACSRPAGCGQNKFQKHGRCCSLCPPGTFALVRCSASSDTGCRPCGSDEYQPDWNNDTRCQPQKLCDPGKGFSSERPSNTLAPEPCRCISGRQCSPIKCEFCEKIPSCGPGTGQEILPESGRRVCAPCKRGFFSSNTSIEPCTPWTNCKALGRSEDKPATDHSDAVCGAGDSSSSWVVVSILFNITILSLIILLLFCYKDKLKLVTVNLRSCVQNLKRTRIQQETLAPLYPSGGGDKGLSQSCPLCETTSLTQGDPCTPSEPPLTCPHPAPTLSIKLPLTPPRQGEEEEEGGEEEGGEEEGSCASPLLACVCVPLVREPLEVGENEDCSQAVNPGTLGPCYCRGGQGEDAGREEGERDEGDAGGEMGEGGEGEGQQSTTTQESKSKSGSTTPPSSLPPSPHFVSSLPPPADLSPDLCPPLTQARTEVIGHLTDRSLQKGRGLDGLKDSLGSASGSHTVPSPPPTVTSLTLSTNGETLSEPSSEASREELDQGLSLRVSGGDKLSPVDLEFSPEILQSDLAEATLTSGQVSGNNNTTFISSGQVMNFSGEVVVVYVSQTSLGNAGAGLENAFGNPVQEQANESAWLFQSLSSKIPTPGNSLSHNDAQDDNLPVQEVTNDWPREEK